ncbi:MAG: VOC family protein [Acidimicrobiales bacterium]|nr:VOC family protein [Acidimicrobiales bacterium]
MPLHRITSIDVAVPDVAAASAFYAAFGLIDDGDGWFVTRDGGRQLRLVPAPRRGLRRLGLAAGSPDDLDRIARSLAALDIDVAHDRRSDECLVLTEPATGLPIELEVAAPVQAAGVLPSPVANRPGDAPRRGRPADGVRRTEPVRPSNLTHLVLGTPDFATTLGVLTDGLGLEISDQLPGVIAFTRAGEVHHTVAVQAAPGPQLHHVAYEVDDADEVGRGASALLMDDPGRHVWGMGRHAIGSNVFWYLRDPAGNFVEYTADVDRIDDGDYHPEPWQGHQFLYSWGPPPPAEFLEPSDWQD